MHCKWITTFSDPLSFSFFLFSVYVFLSLGQREKAFCHSCTIASYKWATYESWANYINSSQPVRLSQPMSSFSPPKWYFKPFLISVILFLCTLGCKLDGFISDEFTGETDCIAWCMQRNWSWNGPKNCTWLGNNSFYSWYHKVILSVNSMKKVRNLLEYTPF
jgi:hypothetical protein